MQQMKIIVAKGGKKGARKFERSNAQHEFDLQISNFSEDDKTYLVISSATKEPFKDGFNAGFSIGLLINNQLKKNSISWTILKSGNKVLV